MTMGKALESMFSGGEPEWTNVSSSDVDRSCALIKAFNWYNNCASDEDRKRWTLEYLKSKETPKETILAIKELSSAVFNIKYGQIPDTFGIDVGVLARLSTLNAPLSEQDNIALNKGIDHLIKLSKLNVPVVSSGVTENKRNVQKSIANCASEIISEIELKLDLVMKSNSKQISWVTEYLKTIKPIYFQRIVDHYQTPLNEIKTVVTGNDVELTEAYFGYTKPALKTAMEFLEFTIKTCKEKLQHHIDNKPVAVRKKRRISPVDIVKKLQYKKEDTELKLKSIGPSKIVGASKLVTFNTKYRTVTIFEADSVNGLSVKGTTILYFDPKKSKVKKLRKPEKFFTEINGKGIRAVKSAFDSIKSVEKSPKGRINEDVILFEVY